MDCNFIRLGWLTFSLYGCLVVSKRTRLYQPELDYSRGKAEVSNLRAKRYHRISPLQRPTAPSFSKLPNFPRYGPNNTGLSFPIFVEISQQRELGFHRNKLTMYLHIAMQYRRVIDVFCLGIQTVQKPNNPFYLAVARQSAGGFCFNSVAERFEPSSRTLLIGEQPNPWGLLQSQDRASRHRGAEHCRRCERSGSTSLLSPE